MKHDHLKGVIVFAFLLTAFVSVSEARGGRGRGGGSFGGIFGGWRKYKKTSSSGTSRRTINGSPMHTTITKQMSSGGFSSVNYAKPIKQTKTLPSYPRQQPPLSGIGMQQTHNGYYGSQLPHGSSFYPNAAAMPPGSIYYAQPPLMRSSSGSGDFLMGMMTGHMMNQFLFPHRSYVTHLYPQTSQNSEQSVNGRQLIIINNGNNTSTNNTAEQQFWPTDTEIPLAPLNATLLPSENQTGIKPIFQKPYKKANSYNNTIFSQVETPMHNSEQSKEQTSPDVLPNPSNIAPQTAGGIICVPLLFNETNPKEPTETITVEKIVCFPAPQPPPAAPQAEVIDCVTQVVNVVDPEDPTKSIQVERKDCENSNTLPPIIAGEITEGTDIKN